MSEPLYLRHRPEIRTECVILENMFDHDLRIHSLRPGEGAAARRLADRAGAVYAPEGELVLAAETHGELVGWVSGTARGLYPGAPVPPPHGYVQAVVVDPDRRRQGVGRRLVEAFLAAAARSGAGWAFPAPDEGEGVEARVAWLASCGFVAMDEPGEVWPVMGQHVIVQGRALWRADPLPGSLKC